MCRYRKIADIFDESVSLSFLGNLENSKRTRIGNDTHHIVLIVVCTYHIQVWSIALFICPYGIPEPPKKINEQLHTFFVLCRFHPGVEWGNFLVMNKLDAAISAYQSGEYRLNLLERPKKKGHPSHAVWKILMDIVKDNLGTLSTCNSFDEICQELEDLAKAHGINLPAWAQIELARQIAYQYDIYPDDSCFLVSSDQSILFDYIGMTGKDALQLLAFKSDQFKGLTKKQQISFLLSHVSLVKEICKQLTINN